MIHGMNAGYNDITPWKHMQLLEVFGAPPNQRKNYQVKTKGEVEELFMNEEFSKAPCIQVPEPFTLTYLGGKLLTYV